MDFRIVRADDFGEASVQRLRFLVRERFGPNTRFDLEYLDEIPQEPSGKYRFCISHVRNPLHQPQEAAAV